MKNILIAASAALVVMVGFTPTEAAARERQSAEKNNSCVGEREKICTVRDPATGIMILTASSRPKGSMMNGTTILVIPTGPDGQPIRNEQGLPFISHAQTLGQANSQAMITGAFAQIPAAILNGVGGVVASNLLCKNCGRQGPSAVQVNYGGNSAAVANSAAVSNSSAQLAAVLKDNGCAAATCH